MRVFMTVVVDKEPPRKSWSFGGDLPLQSVPCEGQQICFWQEPAGGDEDVHRYPGVSPRITKVTHDVRTGEIFLDATLPAGAETNELVHQALANNNFK